MRPELAFKDLIACRGKTPMLRGVTSHFMAGDIIGILGPNGAGKTSLIGGYFRPSSLSGGM